MTLPTSPAQSPPDWKMVACRIDHTLIKTEGTQQEVVSICKQALRYGFHSVSLQPCYIALAADLLRGSGCKVGSVIGFPQGATLTQVKCFEAAEVIAMGAQELDMVMNIGRLKSGARDEVQNDIAAVVRTAHERGVILKVIIETPLLTQQEKIQACEICVAAGADYVKTATGLAGGGATVEDVQLMRSVVGAHVRIKAAGGIRTGGQALAMLAAGADRIGTSASVSIVRDLGAPEPPR